MGTQNLKKAELLGNLPSLVVSTTVMERGYDHGEDEWELATLLTILVLLCRVSAQANFCAVSKRDFFKCSGSLPVLVAAQLCNLSLGD